MLGFDLLNYTKNSVGGGPEQQDFSLNPSDRPSILFETCCRKIWMAPEGQLHGPGLYEGIEAYKFLLEVITGLHSPVFGETEVLGQFKVFLGQQKQNPNFVFFTDWARWLLEDVKVLRTNHLQGKGCHSYGSLLRKHLETREPLWIIGAGQFVQELLPWLGNHDITLWVRNTKKARSRFPKLKVSSLRQTPPDLTAIIVAAPMNDSELLSLLGRTDGDWMDLRSESVTVSSSESRPKGLRLPRTTLKALFEGSERERAQHQDLKALIQGEIHSLSLRRWNHALFRPKGWEDVCAS